MKKDEGAPTFVDSDSARPSNGIRSRYLTLEMSNPSHAGDRTLEKKVAGLGNSSPPLCMGALEISECVLSLMPTYAG